MSGKVVGWAFEVGRSGGSLELSANERYVLVALGDNASEKGKCWPSPKEIIEKTGLGQSTVYRAFSRFRELGLMTDEKDEKGRPFYQLAIPTQGKPFSQREDDSQPGNGSSIREPSQTVTRIFEFWKTTMKLNGTYQLTSERKSKVEARLKSYTPEEVEEAIIGCSLTPHNMGKNDQEEIYNDLELICRNGKNVERFRDSARRKRKKSSGESAGDLSNRRREEAKAQREAEE